MQLAPEGFLGSLPAAGHVAVVTCATRPHAVRAGLERFALDVSSNCVQAHKQNGMQNDCNLMPLCDHYMRCRHANVCV